LAVLVVPGQMSAAQPGSDPTAVSPPAVLRLSLDEAQALFFKQNLDLLITRFGIDFAQGQQITARLFPNPVLTIGTLSSMTSGRTLGRSGEISVVVQQLFEMAGKRGYRIESANFGAQSAES